MVLRDRRLALEAALPRPEWSEDSAEDEDEAEETESLSELQLEFELLDSRRATERGRPRALGERRGLGSAVTSSESPSSSERAKECLLWEQTFSLSGPCAGEWARRRQSGGEGREPRQSPPHLRKARPRCGPRT